MNAASMMHALRRSGQFLEVHQVTFFQVTRIRAGGQVEEVTLAVLDGGADVVNRYSVEVDDGDGRIVAGVPSSSLETAIATLDWGAFDRQQVGN